MPEMPRPIPGSRNILITGVPQENGGAGLYLHCLVHPDWAVRWAGDEDTGAEIPLGVAVAGAFAHMVDAHPHDTTDLHRSVMDNLRRRPPDER